MERKCDIIESHVSIEPRDYIGNTIVCLWSKKPECFPSETTEK